jgi:GWxTD domain-containing protein
MEVGMIRNCLVVLLVLLLPRSGWTQPRGGMPGEEPGEQRAAFLFFEPINLIADTPTLSRLDIPYRIDQSFFVAVVNQKAGPGFVSRGDVLIELVDSLGISKSRYMESIEIDTDKPEGETPGKKWYRGLASFQVPPGPYKIIFEIDDRESERRHIDDGTMLRLKRLNAAEGEISTPVFIVRPQEMLNMTHISPVGFGPHLRFGENASLFLEVPRDYAVDSSTWIDYRFSAQSGADRNGKIELTDTVRSPGFIQGIQLRHSQQDSTSGYAVTMSDSSSATGVIIPFASEKLPLRPYEMSLTFHRGDKSIVTSKRFMMVWPDMPRSLRDVEYAITALKYITTEDQRDSLRRGGFEQRRDKLEAFWKLKDNTPATQYNEVMVEYYQRVDYASKTFGTLREPDGFKADRGRIYILYGPPTSTDRVLDPASGFQEVWRYDKTGKKFIFADQTKSGNYVLISTQTQ